MTDFEHLYQRYSPDIYRFVFWLSGNRADADEITAETFARAWAGADGLRMKTVKSYLFMIARNLVLEGKRRSRQITELNLDTQDEAPDPERIVMGKDRLSILVRTLNTLSEIDRAAVVLRFQEGMSYREISQILGVSLSAVKVKIHRARLRLAAVKEVRQ